ncbi:MAG: sigma-54-dependent Fis family transcriptional regulator [Nitrospirae bacterium]|nr:sigma-54-dependent Fis family transcriptional regulator [Nitrospirota bacterium]
MGNTEKEKILLVDDDKNILEVLKMRLESKGYTVSTSENGAEAIELVKKDRFNLVISDLRMSVMNGMVLLEEIMNIDPELPIIILTAHGSIENAVEAMQKGAYSYITKPFDDEDLLLHIKNALEKQRLTSEIKNLKGILKEKYSFDNIVGRSEKMQKVFEQIAKIAKTNSTVAIYGESGTGKELVARAIHFDSLREGNPFVAISCGALPETLLENELFGHIRGAYTGAVETKEGLFAKADKGTIFLDEIGEAPLSLQVKLLRVLEEREFTQIGGGKPIKVDVRVIVATNRDLQKCVAEGTFREDLFYRIHVIPIYLPPLRERREDIPFLADHFLKKYCKDMDKDIKGFTPSAIQKMMSYNWPGNVRELENRIEQAVVMATKSKIIEDDILLPSKGSGEQFKPYREAKEGFEREYVILTLKINKGNVTNAAKMAGKHRTDFYNLIRKFKINPKEFKEL